MFDKQQKRYKLIANMCVKNDTYSLFYLHIFHTYLKTVKLESLENRLNTILGKKYHSKSRLAEKVMAKISCIVYSPA